jgi:hypothetical protein
MSSPRWADDASEQMVATGDKKKKQSLVSRGKALAQAREQRKSEGIELPVKSGRSASNVSVDMLHSHRKSARASVSHMIDGLDDGTGQLDVDALVEALTEHATHRRSNKHLRRTIVLILLGMVAVVATLLATSVLGSQLAKDVRPDPVSGIMVSNDGMPVKSEVPVSYVTLADLPSRSPSFLNNLRTVTYIKNDVLVTSAIEELEWVGSDFMTIFLARGSRKIVINGRTVTLHEDESTFDLSEADGANGARRMLLEVSGHNARAYSMAELLATAEQLSAGRRLDSSNVLFDLYGLFGGIVASGVSPVTANAEEVELVASDSTTPISIPANSKWDLTLSGGVAATWYLSYNIEAKTARIQQEASEEGTTRVQEVHGGNFYSYTRADTAAILAALSAAVESGDADGQVAAEVEAALLANTNTKSMCSVSVDEKNAAGTDVNWDYEAGLVHPLGGGAGLWQVGGYFMTTDSSGTPVSIVEGDDNSKIVATIASVSEFSDDSGLFGGCTAGTDDTFVEAEDDSGRRLLSMTAFQAWASNTNWCGAGTDTVNTVCPSSGDGDFQADKACRRHDHGAKSNGIIGGMAVRLGCDIDNDLASSTNNWAAQAIFGSWGLAQTWGCFDHSSYNCWNWASKWWGGYWRYGGYCHGENVRYGPWRYSGFSHRYGYRAKDKTCSNDLW